MIGPGKYDDACTKAKEMTEAKGVILIVFEGSKGAGFSAQLPLSLAIKVPTILRDVADQIERDEENGSGNTF